MAQQALKPIHQRRVFRYAAKLTDSLVGIQKNVPAADPHPPRTPARA